MPAERVRSGPETSREDDGPSWHLLGVDEAVAGLASDATAGLGSEEAATRLKERGPNRIDSSERTPAWRMFVSQFNDFMIWVLMVAATIAAFEGQAPEAVAIAAILLLNGVLGFVQEHRAEQALEALKELAAPTATVVRGGVEQEVPAYELVPGDLIVLEAGDRVPADGRLVDVAALKTEEASLTGVSHPIKKSVDPLAGDALALGDRTNMVYAATSVAVGRGRAVVTETGHGTEMGRIAEMLASQKEERTPLQEELRSVGKRIALLVLAIAAIVFFVGAWRAWQEAGGPLTDAFGEPEFRSQLTLALLVAISLAVAAIPEGLPAIVTVSLSLGVKLMAARNAIVRKLHAVETLGSTTFICSDKTGTLTKNEMTVRRLAVGEDLLEVTADWTLRPVGVTPTQDDLDRALLIAASCNDARFTADGVLIGDPTETALLVAADELSADRIRPERVGEVPFESDRKRMTTVHRVDGDRVAFMKGGTDVVLDLCATALVQGETVPMTAELKDRLSDLNAELASGGYRTLALATRTLSGDEEVDEAIERDMVYVGIAGLVDPPRTEVAEAIETCHRAGMEVAMVTGDHALTATAIGSDVGLLHDGTVVTGAELERMSDAELDDIVEDIRIYARVNPVHKLRIVDALKRRGHIVAMTGDGVNDAPALKKADIGVAMGIVGTDVSREAADMVLADDDFATIVEAVRLGRTVFDNLRKFILFLLSCNVSEVLIIFVTAFFADRPALLPLQILWINLVTDGLPALALGVDPAEPGVMERPPRGPDEGILVRRRQLQVLWQGALITGGGLLMYWWAFESGNVASEDRAHTMLFTMLVLAQLLHAFNFRSRVRTIWSSESLKNKWLVMAFVGSLVLQMTVIYVPWLQTVFKTAPLSMTDWLAVVACALVPVVAIDFVKVLLASRGGRESS
jgi:Ca2+-transporting ATPase